MAVWIDQEIELPFPSVAQITASDSGFVIAVRFVPKPTEDWTLESDPDTGRRRWRDRLSGKTVPEQQWKGSSVIPEVLPGGEESVAE